MMRDVLDWREWLERSAPGEVRGVEVLRDTARSLVARATTGDGALYLKHDRILPPPECAVVARLAERSPSSVPQLVAADEALGLGLSVGAGAAGLDGAPTTAWCRVTRTLGEMQRETLVDADEWVGIGCRDLRGAHLHEALLEMLDAARGHVPEHVADRLDAQRPRIAEACDDLADDGIPAGLVHQDVVPENVVVRGDRVVVLDWSDTVVGHPFFACDRLLDACWGDATRKQAVIDAYLGAFEGVAPVERLRASFARVLSLRVLYEDLRWHHEIAAVGDDADHVTRLRNDIAVGLTMVAGTKSGPER